MTSSALTPEPEHGGRHGVGWHEPHDRRTDDRAGASAPEHRRHPVHAQGHAPAAARVRLGYSEDGGFACHARMDFDRAGGSREGDRAMGAAYRALSRIARVN